MLPTQNLPSWSYHDLQAKCPWQVAKINNQGCKRAMKLEKDAWTYPRCTQCRSVTKYHTQSLYTLVKKKIVNDTASDVVNLEVNEEI